MPISDTNVIYWYDQVPMHQDARDISVLQDAKDILVPQGVKIYWYHYRCKLSVGIARPNIYWYQKMSMIYVCPKVPMYQENINDI